jgi:hypothetical protein
VTDAVRELLVHRAGRLVLRIRDNPGTLRSSAPPPPRPAPPLPAPVPGAADALPPGVHPFIDAQAVDAASEGELRALLDESTSFDDYVRRLVAAGYDLTPAAE